MSAPSLSLTAVYEAPALLGPTTEAGVVRFLSLTARAYAAVDVVPARIEEGIAELAAHFGATAECNATATAILLSVRIGDHHETDVVRVRPGDPDFTRMVALHRILGRVMEGEITPDDAAERLVQLLRWRPKRSLVMTVFASALISLSAGLLLRAEAAELAMASVLGGLVGLVLHLVSDRSHLSPLVPVVMAAVASATAFSADRLGLPDVRPVPALVASLVILLPGWRLTTAMTELAQGHWTSGAGRFLAAFTTLLLLIVGVVAGQQGVASTDRAMMVLPSATNLPTWVRVLSPVAAGVAMTVLFAARRRDAFWITLICVVTSLASFLGGRWLGPTASAFVGAFTAMAVGTLIAKRLRLPYPILQQPATVLLVPGSIGFLSMGSFVTRNVNAAMTTGFQMLFVALTLAIGAMTAQVALRPLTSPRRDDA
jgi:uncharacterized membrane protein YjjP (DUF1212 family)